MVLREGPGIATNGACVNDGEVGADGLADIIDWKAGPMETLVRFILASGCPSRGGTYCWPIVVFARTHLPQVRDAPI